jgi:hypothetical protein
MMPCFLVLKGYDILHLLVRGNLGPILRAVGSESDVKCVPCRRALYSMPLFLLQRQEGIFNEAGLFVE